MIDVMPFLLLLLCHVFGDFYLQTEKLVAAKNRQLRAALFAHIAHASVHGLLVFGVLFLAYGWMPSLAAISGIVWLTHFLIDVIKVSSPSKRPLLAFTLDQCAHIAILIAIALYIIDVPTFQLSSDWKHPNVLNGLVYLLAFLLILKPASVVVSLMLESMHSGSPAAEMTLPQGGQILGYLERLIILILIVLNQFAAIGFVIAAKSVLRFSDLNRLRDGSDESKQNALYLTEYVLVGTFTSFLYVLVVGLLVRGFV